MLTTANAAFSAWNIPLGTTLLLLLTGWVYTRGWREIRLTRPGQFPLWRLGCFWGGLGTVWLAFASPIDQLDTLLLTAHMIEHLLLMSIAPPLFALSEPQVPMLRGLPRLWVREGLGPYFRLRPVRAVERLLHKRVAAWIAMNTFYLGWHAPAAYDLALRIPLVHELEHATFLLTSIWFWWPIVEPWPTRFAGSRWMLLPYLLGADLINTSLSASLCFSGKVFYRTYLQAPRIFGVSALEDQVIAGALMWVVGSLFFLGPVMVITVNLLKTPRSRIKVLPATQQPALASPVLPSAGFDLLGIRPISALLKARWGRQALQGILLLVATAVLADGLFGHPMGSMNLAGVIPWTYARSIFVILLLLVGNLFCMSCPFTLPRELGKRLGAWAAARLGRTQPAWPRALRNKWLPAGLLLLFFWAYERWALWDVPKRTAWLLVAYFATAFAIDTVFRGASFCKYVCPVGQFNFVSSLVSPLELRSRSLAVCSACSTRDCIAGSPAPKAQRGCELDLFMPAKSSNLDCTLCMDCVKACPHDNIGLFAGAPARELVQLTVADPQRSSVGRLARRPDVAALAVVLAASALGSAAAMTSPGAALLARAGGRLPAPLVDLAGLGVALALAAAVWALVAAAAALIKEPALAPGVDGGWQARVCRWSLALVPLGLGMWAAHLAYHLLMGWNSVVPTAALALRELAQALHLRVRVATPDWSAERSLLTPGGLLGAQFAFLDAGLLLSLYVGWRMVRGRSRQQPPVFASLRAVAPWVAVAVLFYVAGAGLLLLPMQMRGMVGM